ncbi:hypothetical protein [Campylobacter helveticus]|uniref:hypothetical protein n=1 Tax=Campylobacter helveticus TaxID=28898 RepID=UPI0022EAE092|nr:hypothetical protein [Campylobacter helveticus]
MDFLNLKGDYVVEILSYYLWGQSTPPSDLARKDNRVLIGKDYQARDGRASITIEASAFDYMQYVDRYTNATNFGVFQKFFKYPFNEEELRLFKDRIENGFYVLGLDDIVKKLYKKNPFVDGEGKYNEENMDVAISHYGLDSNSSDYAKRAFAFGSTRIAFNEDVKFYINAKTYEPFCLSNLKLYPLEDNFDFESDNGFAKIINPYLEKKLDPLKIGRIVNIKFVDIEKIEPISISKKYFQELEDKKQNRLKSIYLMPPNSPATSLSTASSEPFLSSRAFLAYYNNNILPSGVLYTQDDDISTHLQNSTFSSQSKQAHSTTSPSSPKEPSFITLILQDEWGKAITNAKVIIKGFRYDESLSVVKLKRKSDTLGKIRFDKEKYFGDCYSFKVKLEDNEAYLSTPLQNAKRIFNNYVEHKIGLILKFKAKEHLVYDGFNVYYYKGRDLITSYLARSGTAKADNIKQSDKQIAHYFYQDEKDKSKGKKAYFYYDDASIKEQFGTLPEGKYYFKINEIAKDLNPSFLKDYPFEIGRTWGKYCVRLYTDKECSKTSKEIKDKDKEQTIIKDNLYLYSVNEKAEFGSSGSIGMAQGELLELFHHQSRFVEDEREGVVPLKVEYVKKKKYELEFIKEIQWELDEHRNVVGTEKGAELIIDEKASFAPGTYVELKADGLKENANIVWVLAEIHNETRLQRILDGKEELEFKDVKFLKDESGYFHQCYKSNSKANRECNKIGFSLPLTRTNEEEFDKYYALVFAYEDKIKRLPNLSDAYKIIDMSFRVGFGRDDRVQELFTREKLKVFNIYHLNQQKSINSIEEANWFLRAILEDCKTGDFFTYLRTHPQLAGKIAYIYYRFDLINKEFLTSVSEKDKKAYLWDRDDKYSSTIINEILALEYKDGKSFKQFYTKLANDEDRNLKECEDFLQALTQTICEKFNLPLEKVVFFNKEPSTTLLFGAYGNNKIGLNRCLIKTHFETLVKTVFHECRHFYIEKYYHRHMDALSSYVFYSRKTYIDEWVIFNGFHKFCDCSQKNLVDCIINRNQNAYEIQPNERDPRYVETFIARNL